VSGSGLRVSPNGVRSRAKVRGRNASQGSTLTFQMAVAAAADFGSCMLTL